MLFMLCFFLFCRLLYVFVVCVVCVVYCSMSYDGCVVFCVLYMLCVVYVMYVFCLLCVFCLLFCSLCPM